MKTTAHIRLKLDVIGRGEVVLNGIHIGHVVRSVRLTSAVDEGTIVQLDILAELVEVEGTDIQMLLNELKPEDPGPLIHQWRIGPHASDPEYDVCTVCRQVRRVAAAVCPGTDRI